MIKDIVVHLTGSPEDAVRLSFAATVARSLEARVTGLQVHALPDVIAITDPSGSAFLRTLLDESSKAADKVTATLQPRLEKLGLSSELRRLDVLPGRIGEALAAEARTADLFIGTRPYGDPARQQYIEETVLFSSGRGCVFVPPQAKLSGKIEAVFVAWNNTREAARAVAEALPLLQQAKLVVVGLVEERGASERFGDQPGADIGRYLSRHNVLGEIRMVNGWSDAGSAILNEAKALQADLIVMGGYGHSRFREWALGGATRHVLLNSEVPVLMAH
jgi:nucleotide-binding universal stress UspA family protein